MRLTPILSVRHLLAKLHPPPLKTPRESQQLLSILEGSFRKHLDDTHPPPIQRQPASTNPSDIPLASLDSSSNATNHYFDTILNNPLLARPAPQDKHRATFSVNAAQLFTKAALEGNVTVPLLRKCMGDYFHGFKHGERVVEAEKLTPKIAAWLYTANTASREAFLSSTELLNIAVKITGAEQQEAIAWDWLRMVYERNFGSDMSKHGSAHTDLKWLNVEDILVSYIMRLSLRRDDANDAAQQLIEACRYRLESRRAAPRAVDVTNELKYVPLEHSWKRFAASVIFYRNKHGIVEDVFDRALVYSLSWSSAPHFSEPILLVYHPVTPSAVSLYHHLKDLQLARQFLSAQGLNKRYRRNMLLAILDGAQVSLDQGRRAHAQFLLNFAHVHFSDFLPALTHEGQPSLDAAIKTAHEGVGAHTRDFVWA